MSRQCPQCGCIGAQMVEIYHEGVLLVEGVMCDPCFDHSIEKFEQFQAEFEDMLERGVHPRMANRIMEVRVQKSA